MSVRFFSVSIAFLLSALCGPPSLSASSNDCFTPETGEAEKLRDVIGRGSDEKKRSDWAQNAVNANHAAVIHQIGRGYLEQKQYDKAYLWYEKGVRLGDYQAMYDLGVMWLRGEGREIDLSKAYGWFLLTGEYIPINWDDYFFPPRMIEWHKSLAKNLAKKMTEEQITAGNTYYEEQKKLVQCDWYEWYGNYMSLSRKRP